MMWRTHRMSPLNSCYRGVPPDWQRLPGGVVRSSLNLLRLLPPLGLQGGGYLGLMQVLHPAYRRSRDRRSTPGRGLPLRSPSDRSFETRGTPVLAIRGRSRDPVEALPGPAPGAKGAGPGQLLESDRLSQSPAGTAGLPALEDFADCVLRDWTPGDHLVLSRYPQCVLRLDVEDPL